MSDSRWCPHMGAACPKQMACFALGCAFKRAEPGIERITVQMQAAIEEHRRMAVKHEQEDADAIRDQGGSA